MFISSNTGLRITFISLHRDFLSNKVLTSLAVGKGVPNPFLLVQELRTQINLFSLSAVVWCWSRSSRAGTRCSRVPKYPDSQTRVFLHFWSPLHDTFTSPTTSEQSTLEKWHRRWIPNTELSLSCGLPTSASECVIFQFTTSCSQSNHYDASHTELSTKSKMGFTDRAVLLFLRVRYLCMICIELYTVMMRPPFFRLERKMAWWIGGRVWWG